MASTAVSAPNEGTVETEREMTELGTSFQSEGNSTQESLLETPSAYQHQRANIEEAEENQQFGGLALSPSDFAALEMIKHKSGEGLIENEEDEWPDCDTVIVLLALNEAYGELVDHLIYKIEKAIEENKRKQKDLMLKQRTQREVEVAVKKKVPVMQFLPPYFKDANLMCPPLSAEAKRKCENTKFDPLMKEEKKWTPTELKTLRAAVRISMLSNKIQPLIDRRDILQDKIKKSGIETTVEERNEWKEEVSNIERKINYERNIPEEDMIVGDYSKIDWAKIACTDFKGGRTPTALRLKWINEQCPRWNKAAWTKEELKKLKDLRENKFVSWGVLADRLGTRRTPWQCFEKYKSELWESSKEWTKEEDEKLIALVNMLKINNKVQWDKVTYYMPGRHRQQVRLRYIRTLDKNVKHGRWTNQEDLLLMCAVGRMGAKDWAKIARAVPGRNDAQCRERWVNVLDKQNIGQEWTVEEDEKLLYGLQVFGRGAWAKTAQILDKRTAKQCKSRYRALLTTKMRLCTSQMDAIRRSNNCARVQHSLCSIRRNRLFRQFNEMVQGDDDTGDKFCERVHAATQREQTNISKRASLKSKKTITEEERKIIEQGIQQIDAKHRGNNVDVSEVVKDLQLDEKDVFRIMQRTQKRSAYFKRAKYVFRGEDNRVAKIRKTMYLMADSLPERTEFPDDVAEEERIMCLTEALCQAVRKYDQHQWNNDFTSLWSGEAAHHAATYVKHILTDRCDEVSRNTMEGRPIPLDATISPNSNSLAALTMIERSRMDLNAMASTYFNKSSIAFGDNNLLPHNAHKEQFTITDRMNIQLSPQITQSSEYIKLKSCMRAILLEPYRLQIALDAPDRAQTRLKCQVDIAERELEEENLREGLTQMSSIKPTDVDVDDATERLSIYIDQEEMESIIPENIESTIDDVVGTVCGPSKGIKRANQSTDDKNVIKKLKNEEIEVEVEDGRTLTTL